MRTALPFAIVFTLLPALASGQQEKVQDSLPAAPAGMTWKQIWNDDFDGTVLDENKWTYRPDAKRKDGWWDRKAVTLDGKGNLVIKTYKDGDKNIDGCITTRAVRACLRLLRGPRSFPETTGSLVRLLDDVQWRR